MLSYCIDLVDIFKLSFQSFVIYQANNKNSIPSSKRDAPIIHSQVHNETYARVPLVYVKSSILNSLNRKMAC